METHCILFGVVFINILYGIEYVGITGINAIRKLLKEKQGHVKKAFYRKDIGYIDLFWGDSSAGLSHIVSQRRKDNMDVQQLLKDLPIVIKRGSLGVNANSTDRENIFYKDKVIVITHELRGESVTAILTAFCKNRKV